MLSRLKKIGPGAIVVAAVIGPGTVTACTIAGASFGYALLWALVFATLATVILQEMSARLGIVTQRGLGDNLRALLEDSVLKWPLFLLIGVALFLGNAAYQAGNISGAALGIEAIAGENDGIFRAAVLTIGLAATILLMTGSYKLIERTLIGLVFIISIAFFATLIIVQPDLPSLAKGLFIPSIPDGSLLTVIALIGTTVVPYNLFLHASAVTRRWKGPEDLAEARADTATAIGIGGLVTICIVATASAGMFAQGLTVESGVDMAQQFEPLFGSYSKYLLGIGLFAAGLSSAITAPLATAYAITEVAGLERDEKSKSFRVVAFCIVALGVGLSMTGVRPVEIIVAAQFANGLLLPIMGCFLLYAMNRRELLGDHTNSLVSNLLGVAVVLISAGLGCRLVLQSIGIL